MTLTLIVLSPNARSTCSAVGVISTSLPSRNTTVALPASGGHRHLRHRGPCLAVPKATSRWRRGSGLPRGRGVARIARGSWAALTLVSCRLPTVDTESCRHGVPHGRAIGPATVKDLTPLSKAGANVPALLGRRRRALGWRCRACCRPRACRDGRGAPDTRTWSVPVGPHRPGKGVAVRPGHAGVPTESTARGPAARSVASVHPVGEDLSDGVHGMPSLAANGHRRRHTRT